MGIQLHEHLGERRLGRSGVVAAPYSTGVTHENALIAWFPSMGRQAERSWRGIFHWILRQRRRFLSVATNLTYYYSHMNKT